MNAKHIVMCGACVLAWTGAVYAQSPTPTPSATPRECSVPIYKGAEVDRKVKILDYPAPHFAQRDIDQHPGSVIVLRAIFCGSGRVTDVKVQKGVSQSLDEEAIRTSRTIKFRPAEKDGQPASQWLTLEYRINN